MHQRNKILITGSSGFIGSHLKENLKKSDFIAVTTKEVDNVNTENVVVIDSYSSTTNWLNILDDIDVIIHLAGCAHAQYSLEEYEEINYLSTLNLIEQAAKSNVKKIIFISTILVHGERGELNINSKLSPESRAAISKLKAENAIKYICENSPMNFVIVRSPIVYGEGVKANFASLMKLVGKGLPLPFGSIKSNKRSLVSVYNLVDLIKVCIEHPKAADQIFLASDDCDLSTAEMVALMAKVQNKRNLSLPVPVWCFKLLGKLLNKPGVIDRLTGSLQLDISHTKNTLDWEPPYSVGHGFKLAVKMDEKND